VIELLKKGNIQNVGPLPEARTVPQMSSVSASSLPATVKPETQAYKFKPTRATQTSSRSSLASPSSGVLASKTSALSSRVLERQPGTKPSTDGAAPTGDPNIRAPIVIGSPSFVPSNGSQNTTSPSVPASEVPQGPPAVMSYTVRERKGMERGREKDGERKVSKFLSERR
jgi:hypothetical protein